MKSLLAIIISLGMLFLVGCSSNPNFIEIRNEYEFNKLLENTHKPLIIEFYCCRGDSLLEKQLSVLENEYRGKIVFARYNIKTLVFQVEEEKIRNFYNINYLPTVSMFIDKWEENRWVWTYSLETYRYEIDRTLEGTQSRMTFLKRKLM